LYESYKDRIAFYVVYIQEAHPTDLWQLSSNTKDGVLFASAKSAEERSSTASSCVRKLGIQIPAVLDKMDDGTERAYTGWPDRIYLIDQNGRVAFKTAPGPFGFSTSDLELALNEITNTRSRSSLKIAPNPQ
jgi:type I thyroxine 5'-deiodinase